MDIEDLVRVRTWDKEKLERERKQVAFIEKLYCAWLVLMSLAIVYFAYIGGHL